MNLSAHDDFSRTPVSKFNLRSWWYLLVIEMGVMISIPILILGGQLGLGLSLSDLIVATFAGAAILGVIGSMTAQLGAVTRCSTALIARLTFGRKGSSSIALLLALGMIGWWGVQTEMFSNAVVQLAQQLFHLRLPFEIVVALGGTAMIITAALGIRAIGRLSYLAVPLVVIGLAWGLNSLLTQGKLNLLLHYQPSVSLGLGTAAATVAGGFIVGASMNPDYSRFARTRVHALAYALSDYALIYPLLLIVCGAIAISFGSSNIVIHLVPEGYAWVVFLMVMLATWAANDCNLYSSSLGLATVFPTRSRAHLAIVAGLIGIALAEFHIAGHIISFLTVLGILIAPISSVFVVNSFGRVTPVTTEELSAVNDWHIGPLTAWACGAGVGYIGTPSNSLGLGLIKLTTIPTLDAVLVAGVIMLLVKILHRASARLMPSTMEPVPVQSGERLPSERPEHHS